MDCLSIPCLSVEDGNSEESVLIISEPFRVLAAAYPGSLNLRVRKFLLGSYIHFVSLPFLINLPQLIIKAHDRRASRRHPLGRLLSEQKARYRRTLRASWTPTPL